MNRFQITTEEFEGPIEALLNLIEKRKLPINDISLADITDDYILYLQNLEKISLSERTHFLFVASTLILIKSKSILPSIDLSDEEEGDIQELKRRIAELKLFQELGVDLKKKVHNLPQYYYPQSSPRQIIFDPHASIKPRTLSESLVALFKEIPKLQEKKKEGYVKIAVHIDEMMSSLKERIERGMKGDFSSFVYQQSNGATGKKMRVYQVVGFLALLELVKKGSMQVKQKNNFSSISMKQYE